MPVSPGQDWGRSAPLPPGAPVAENDAELAGCGAPVVGLLGGDMARTLGASGNRSRLGEASAVTLPVDMGEATLDGVVHRFAAHLVLRGRYWRSGPAIAVMNAEWHGKWDMAPRGHPNDGFLDVVDMSLTVGERLRMGSRLRTGTHMPHPRITCRRVREESWRFVRPRFAWVDGKPVGRVRDVAVRCIPDAVDVVI